MSVFLNELNTIYNSQPMKEWFESEFFYLDGFKDDIVYQIFSKHFFEEKPLVLEEEVNVLLSEYSESHNIYVRAILDYLIACSKNHYNDSKLPIVCSEFIEMYFQHIDEFMEQSPVHVLSKVVKWTITKFPQVKEKVSSNLFSRIIQGEKNNLRFLSMVIYFIDDKLTSLFTCDEYCSIFEYFYITDISKDLCLLYYDFYKTLVNTIVNEDKKQKKKYYKYLVDFVIKNIYAFDDYTKHSELQTITDYMDYVGSYSDDDYYLINSELERVNKASLERLQQFSIEIPKNITDSIKLYRQKSTDAFKVLSNDRKISFLICNIRSLSRNNLSKNIEESKRGFLGFAKESILDSTGRIINYKKLTAEESFSLNSGSYIRYYVDVSFDIVISPFFLVFSLDDCAKTFIKDIVNNCSCIDAKRKDYVFNLFCSFFKKDFKNSVFDIVLEFEDILRNYFKSKKLNIVKKDGTKNLIGLNNVFNNYDKNSFRDALLELIDEDYYFTLKWLLTDNYGFDLRDKISHRYQSESLFENTYAVISILYIFKLIMSL